MIPLPLTTNSRPSGFVYKPREVVTELPPSSEQSTVYQWIEVGHGSAIVESGAGTGKTTLLLGALRRIPNDKTTYLGAYNKAIAQEIQEKALASLLDRSTLRIGTIHSAGFISCKRIWKSTQVDDRKTYLINNQFPEQKPYETFIHKLVGFAKQFVVGVKYLNEPKKWFELVELFSLEEELTDNQSVEQGIEYAMKVFQIARDTCDKIIDFDDMIYAPLAHGLSMFQNDWVLVDEVQDSSEARIELAAKMLKPNGRFLGAGDTTQCHPAGTGIYVTNQGYIPIETLKIGDEVATYNNGMFSGHTTSGRSNNYKGVVVEDISSRYYEGDIINIEVSDRSHEVTPNHKCLVKMPDQQGSLVYAMQKGKKARIGRCNIRYGSGFGLSMRAHQEGADAAWVIAIFTPEQEFESRLLEIQLAYQYGFPQLCFQYGWETGVTHEFRERFWNDFPDNIDNLKLCLEDWNLKHEFPFWYKGSGTHVGGKYAFILYAANLISNRMEVLVYDEEGKATKPRWERAIISKQLFKGDVWSLKVSPSRDQTKSNAERRLYIANGIVTHNSIFAFAGAMNDAMDRVKKRFQCKTMALTVTYRCPKVIVNYANEWMPNLRAGETAPNGIIRQVNQKCYACRGKGYQTDKEIPCSVCKGAVLPWYITDRPRSDNAILCRYTRPLIKTAYGMLREGIRCKIEGRDLGKGLERIATKWKIKTLDKLLPKLQAFENKLAAKYTAQDRASKAEEIHDQFGALYILIERTKAKGLETIEGLKAEIALLFEDNVKGAVTLCSGHRSKGREWVKVYILETSIRQSKQPWEAVQERNLRGVMGTRSQWELVLVPESVGA
jgi:hypothetical protein